MLGHGRSPSVRVHDKLRARLFRAGMPRSVLNVANSAGLDYYRTTRESDILVPSDSGIGLVAWGLPVVDGTGP